MRQLQLAGLFAALAIAPAVLADSNTNAAFPVTITVDAAKPIGELTPIWRFFGADEPNYAYMKDGKKLLSELGQLGGPQVYFRAHHLLTSGDGAYALKWGSTSAYKEDANGNPVYDWTINDRIFDTYLERGVKPYVEIGFMPEALSTHPQDYPHNPPVKKRAPADAGQSYPPKDYAKWGELVYQWARHCVEKYGAAEVEQVVLGSLERAEHQLLARLARGLFQALRLRGGRRAPRAADRARRRAGNGGRGRQWILREFLEHCAHGTNYVTGKIGSPLDFFSFHAKGSPVFTNGHVRMGMANQFAHIDAGFAVITSHFPNSRNMPIVIGESDPEGCAACRATRDGYRNSDDVFELHRGEFYARAGPRGRRRRESSGRADVGV